MKTVVYVDGFNLYYRALKGSRFKWLNLSALCDAVLPNDSDVNAIHYYTARVSGRGNPTAPKDQNTYLKALATLPKLHIHYGNFQVTNKWMYVLQPLEFSPPSATPSPSPEFIKVVKTEEKGSDVNLGVHLVRDAFLGGFERAVVLTNDTDLAEPLRIVVHEAKLPLILLTPVNNPAGSLTSIATAVRHISPYLGVSQFPPILVGSNGKEIPKPPDW